MSYTREEFDTALSIACPYWRKAKMARPEALRSAALNLWRNEDEGPYAQTLREAYNDLCEKGQFVFIDSYIR